MVARESWRGKVGVREAGADTGLTSSHAKRIFETAALTFGAQRRLKVVGRHGRGCYAPNSGHLTSLWRSPKADKGVANSASVSR